MKMKDTIKFLKIFFFALIILSFLVAERTFSSQESKSILSQITNSTKSAQTVQFFLIEPNFNEENETHSSFSDQFISFYYKENFAHNHQFIKLYFNYPNYVMGNALLIYSLGSRSPPLS